MPCFLNISNLGCTCMHDDFFGVFFLCYIGLIVNYTHASGLRVANNYVLTMIKADSQFKSE